MLQKLDRAGTRASSEMHRSLRCFNECQGQRLKFTQAIAQGIDPTKDPCGELFKQLESQGHPPGVDPILGLDDDAVAQPSACARNEPAAAGSAVIQFAVGAPQTNLAPGEESAAVESPVNRRNEPLSARPEPVVMPAGPRIRSPDPAPQNEARPPRSEQASAAPESAAARHCLNARNEPNPAVDRQPRRRYAPPTGEIFKTVTND